MKEVAILVKNLSSGGAEKQAVLLAKTLNTHYKVHFIIFNGVMHDEKLLSWLKEDESIHIEYLFGSKCKRLRYMHKYLKSNEISDLFCYLTGANLYGVLATRNCKTTKIYSGIRNARLPFAKLLIDRILTNHFVTKSVLNSFSAEEYFSKKGFKRRKMVVIPNCFECVSPIIEKQNNDKVRIITVARFVPQKDYYTALKVIAELVRNGQNIIYQIVGYGSEESSIRNWIKELGIEDAVGIFINPNNIEELLKKADIYFTTSLFEGTSNSIMEAMDAGLPIVATDVGDNNKLVSDDINGYIVKVKDVKNMTLKISRLATDSELRKSMGLQSNEILKKNYSVDSFRQKYQDLIENKI